MGGGKTHNMIALGLLAKNPALREKVLGQGGYGSKVGGVSSQGEELYHILRTRLFQTLPDQAVRTEVANAYS